MAGGYARQHPQGELLKPTGGWSLPAVIVRRAITLGAGLVGRPELGQVLPDFVLIGAMKAGTTSLFAILAAHPGVLTPRRREIHFFGRRFGRGVGWYRRHFPTGLERKGRITGEGSTSYLSNPAVPERMYATLPGARLIALLRNPVDRAISNYFHERRAGREPLEIEAAFAAEAERLRQHPAGSPGGLGYLAYRERGHYADQLARFLALYPREQLLILQSEAFFADPRATLESVYRFLALDPRLGTDDFTPRNLGGYDPSQVPGSLVRQLREHFEPHNERLFELIGERWEW